MDPQEPNPEEREAQIQRILRQVEQQLRQSLPDGRQPLEQTEQQVVEIGQQIREIIETEVLAPLDQDEAEPHTRCACGQPARYVAHYPRQLVTLNGERRLRRAYYHCATCQHGFCPLDRLLEIGPRQSSVGVRALAARFASYLPPRQAATELALITGIALSASTVAVEATAVGQALQRQWAAAEKRLWAGRAPAPRERPAQLQVSMDGVLIRVGNDWKEAKLGAVYRSRPGGGVEQARYYASQGDSVAFGRRLRTLAQQEGVDYCPAVAVVGDGADWIWQETAKHFSRSVEILDYYHALEHLWAVARACLADEAACKAWIATVQERLLKDEVRAVIREIARWEPATAAAGEVQRKAVSYLRTHEHRMQYGTFRSQGYQIGSGVVESGCKTVVQARLKGAGMRWSRGGAEAMLHLRAAWCSTGRTDFLAAAKQATVHS
jgi:hypothetical protein